MAEREEEEGWAIVPPSQWKQAKARLAPASLGGIDGRQARGGGG